MSEKTWQYEVSSFGGWLVWHGDKSFDSGAFYCESEASAARACVNLNALTSERDEAVRERDELRANHKLSIERLRMTISSYTSGQAHDILLGACDIELAALQGELDSLGGIEPQEEG